VDDQLDDDRMPIVNRRSRRSAAVRREPGGGPALVVVALAAIVGVGCVAPRPLPTGSGAPTARPAATAADGRSPAAATSAAALTASPTSGPAGGPTPLPDLQPGSGSLTTYTVVCEDWGSELPPSTIGCADAVALALAAIGGERAAFTRRLDFWFGDGCDRGVPCAERRPDAGWVVARSATSETLGIRVALDPAGELRAWPPLPGPIATHPAFMPPPAALPDLGGNPPAELHDRRPTPFCGTEDLTTPDAFATKARTCFLGGVLAGVPVELVSRSFSTEGHALLTLYRFAGQGPILRYVRAAAGWTGSACGISPIRTSAIFLLAGTCERLTP